MNERQRLREREGEKERGVGEKRVREVRIKTCKAIRTKIVLLIRSSGAAFSCCCPRRLESSFDSVSEKKSESKVVVLSFFCLGRNFFVMKKIIFSCQS